jgi:alkylation response protein AidB-like acyl-CoA dehydrogenase
MTEPNAGSAATELKTRAEPKEGYYILNGTKIFITRASVSNIFIVFARIGNEPGAKGICSFVVERGTPGFVIGKAEKLMGLRGGGSANWMFLKIARFQKKIQSRLKCSANLWEV